MFTALTKSQRLEHEIHVPDAAAFLKEVVKEQTSCRQFCTVKQPERFCPMRGSWPNRTVAQAMVSATY
jgi:hypothetical protein